MYGLIDIQRSMDSSAKQGIQHAAALEQQRKATHDQIKQADNAAMKSNIAQGAGMGAMIGMQAGSVGGPMGAVIGAGAGYLLHTFL